MVEFQWLRMDYERRVLLAAWAVLAKSEEKPVTDFPMDYADALIHLAGSVRTAPGRRIKYKLEKDFQENGRRKYRASNQKPRLSSS